MPWMELSRKAQPAGRNLLMNYISPLAVVSLYRSGLAGHFPVTLGALGGFVAKGLVIASTGLLALETKPLTYESEFRMVDRFNFTKPGFNAADYSVTYDAAVMLWANSQWDAPFRPGVTKEQAVLSFAVNPDLGLGSDDTLSANSAVFAANPECQPFFWTYIKSNESERNTTFGKLMPQTDFDILSPFCLISGIAGTFPQKRITETPLYVLNSTIPVDNWCPTKTKTDFDQYKNTHLFANLAFDWPNGTTTVAALLCRPQYSLTRRLVKTSSGNPAGGDILEVGDILDTMALELSPFYLTTLVFRSILRYQMSLTNNGDATWVSLMNFTASAPNLEAFADPEAFRHAFQTAYKAVSSLAAKYAMMVPAAEGEKLPGLVTQHTPRLVVTQISLRIMEGFLAILALVAFLLSRYSFKSVLARSSSIADAAIVLAHSEPVAKVLPVGAALTAEALETKLDGRLFSSPPDLSAIEMTNNDAQLHRNNIQQGQFDDDDDDDDDGDAAAQSTAPMVIQSWRPYAVTRTAGVLLIITTIVLFSALEILYQLSTKRGGLAQVNMEGYARYYWVFLPSVVMAALGLAYGSVDTGIRRLSPFLQLKSAASKTERRDAIDADPSASVALVALARALWQRNLRVALATLVAVLGSLLTIAASGLYSTNQPSVEIEFDDLALGSWFDISSHHGDFKDGDSSGTEDIFTYAVQFQNLSYPVGTYSDLALALPDPTSLLLRAATRLDPTSNGSATVRATVPAAQTRANCTLHQFWEKQAIANASRYEIVVDPLPPGCRSGTDDKRRLQVGRGYPEEGYFAYLALGQWVLSPGVAADKADTESEQPAASNKSATTGINRSPYAVCNDSVQHEFFAHGRVMHQTFYNLTLLHCVPYVQALRVEATFKLPSLEIDPDSPPPTMVPGSAATPWNHPRNPDRNSIALFEPLVDGEDFLPFFSVALAAGKDGTPLDEFSGRERADALIRRVDKLYGEIGAQALHFNFRRDMANITALRDAAKAGNPIPARTVKAVMKVPLPAGQGRLVQSEISTRLLEALLLALAVCAAISFWLMGDGKVVPVDPGSIAARMALLAGSELVAKVRDWGREGLAGRRISLRWWRRGTTPVYGIDVEPRPETVVWLGEQAYLHSPCSPGTQRLGEYGGWKMGYVSLATTTTTTTTTEVSKGQGSHADRSFE